MHGPLVQKFDVVDEGADISQVTFISVDWHKKDAQAASARENRPMR